MKTAQAKFIEDWTKLNRFNLFQTNDDLYYTPDQVLEILKSYHTQFQPQGAINAEELKKYCTTFFYWWWNQKGNDTTDGYDRWIKEVNPKLPIQESPAVSDLGHELRKYSIWQCQNRDILESLSSYDLVEKYLSENKLPAESPVVESSVCSNNSRPEGKLIVNSPTPVKDSELVEAQNKLIELYKEKSQFLFQRSDLSQSDYVSNENYNQEIKEVESRIQSLTNK